MPAIITFPFRSTAPKYGTFTKHGWSRIKIAIDWSEYLVDEATTIADSTWILANSGNVTFDGAAVDGNLTTIDVSGGLPGETASTENRVTFGDGSRDVFHLVAVIHTTGAP